MLPGRFPFYVEMREPQDDPANCAGKRTQKQFTVTIRTQPWVAAPSIPPPAEVGMPFRMALRARGGSGTFVWELVDGKLPAGIRLRDDGSISGVPRTAGTFRVVATARDTEARSLRWPLRLGVAPRLLVPAQRLPAASVGRMYSANLTVAGGVGPKRWKVARGRLPRGVRLVRALGRLSGTPREPGRHLVTVHVSDRLEATSTRTLAILVRDAPRPVEGR